jgi:hypothetical protein
MTVSGLIESAVSFRRETSALENLTDMIKNLNLPAATASALKGAVEMYSQSKRYEGVAVQREDEVLGEGAEEVVIPSGRRGSSGGGRVAKRVYGDFDMREERDALKKVKTGKAFLDMLLSILKNKDIPESDELGTSGWKPWHINAKKIELCYSVCCGKDEAKFLRKYSPGGGKINYSSWKCKCG